MATALAPPPTHPAKRKATTAGLPGTQRPVKRRASKACHCCRARKVRCNVVENGAPCTNCRLDEVECIVTESKRRKKSRAELEFGNQSPGSSGEGSEDLGFVYKNDPELMNGFTPPINPDVLLPLSPSMGSMDCENKAHVPHMIYRSQGQRLSQSGAGRRTSVNAASSQTGLSQSQIAATVQRLFNPRYMSPIRPSHVLPNFIRPLPPRITADDVEYLEKKGALSVPETGLRNELLRNYVQYVHGYMALLELQDFLQVIERNDGSTGKISLLLFQAVMFAGTAFIDMHYLRAAGYRTRKAARKVFFQRARLLYDFDYEVDRISLVQALLLMTYWYETPDDQKDTWHWMGVSLSLAHTIGLHRDPQKSNMDMKRQRLWKRIWWSCFMRDRLIALGMRRPTRIKNEDCDVPMLTLDDFELGSHSPEVVRMLKDCRILADVEQQTQIAIMCIEKAKLCLCISHVLAAQYSVLSHKFGGTTETTMMLVPKKSAAETNVIMQCDEELDNWINHLPEVARYELQAPTVPTNGEEVLIVHRALLNMIHLTTSSALHRPQVLPSAPFPNVATELQELSRTKVREAATEITSIAQDLHSLNLSTYLPTTGVTVLLPAVIIHLLDIKSNDTAVRNASLRRFHQCMQILQRLREVYASADFATSFLEAAIRKANIQVPPGHAPSPLKQSILPKGTIDAHRLHTLTPPPDVQSSNQMTLDYFNVTPRESELFMAATPPTSEASRSHSVPSSQNGSIAQVPGTASLTDLMEMANSNESDLMTQNDFDALINLDGGADLFAAEEGLGVDMSAQGESSGFTLDMDWMKDLPEDVDHLDKIHLGNGQRLGEKAITGDLDADLGLVDDE